MDSQETRDAVAMLQRHTENDYELEDLMPATPLQDEVTDIQGLLVS